MPDLRELIGLEDQYDHIFQKIVRDSTLTRGDNTLNPFKNRGARWAWPVVVFPNQVPPKGWKRTHVTISKKGKNFYFGTSKKGFGYYVLYNSWLRALRKVRKRGYSAKDHAGDFKVGIPYEQAATRADCQKIALVLGFQARRVMGESKSEIKKMSSRLWRASRSYSDLSEPICPFCRRRMSGDGFVEASSDTSDVFFKRNEARDDAIQLFHIRPLRPGIFLHRPGNVSWGHRRCNVTVGPHSINETLDWFQSVLKKHGRDSTKRVY